ncbi:MAG TPA: ABC transporter ATP-binding protein [Candidatus Dormibacteraeota bacterium]|nr:ABC transporter ATP-binding protein [Candidatus Dormibacteraeota bacterium]
MSHLSLQGIVKRYAGRTVVDGVDLAVERSELMCILGPSGCGKTTLLGIVAGFVELDAGEIVVAGRSIGRVPPHRRNMGMVFQNYALFPHLTVEDNVAFGLRLRRASTLEIRRRVAAALALTRLGGFERRYPHQLSGGQQQRVAMARVLAIEPDVLLLDEPFSNLDAKLRREMRDEVRRIQKTTGITTIFVTHDQEEALAISDRVAVMRDGRIEQIDDCRSIYERPRTPFVASFMGESNRLGGIVEAVDGDRAMLRCSGDVRASGLAPHPPLSLGQEALLFVRPERVLIAPAGGSTASDVVLTGTIEGLMYLGARTRIAVRTPVGPFNVEASDLPDHAMEVGRQITIGWQSRHAVVFPAEGAP